MPSLHDSDTRRVMAWVDGEWHDGDPLLLRASSQATWLASMVFDGARSFRRRAPDLDLHCQRVGVSALSMGLKPTKTGAEILDIALEGIRRFPDDAELYIRPMFWAEGGFVIPDPDSTRFAMVITETPLPARSGFSTCLSSYQRPAPNTAPTDAKASCLYPNAARALREAEERGFQNAVVRDLLGNVAEFATANLFMVKDGVAVTPVPNGTFLNGITRQRIIALLRENGTTVEERTVTVADLEDADEIFSSGNYAKVSPVTRFEDHDLQPGPVAESARDLYFNYAETARV